MKRGDIWMSRKMSAVSGSARSLWRASSIPNTMRGIVSFSPDGSTMYLTRAVRKPAADSGTAIYTSQRSDAKWSAPVILEITADTVSNHAHPAVSPSGEWLYFVIRHAGAKGGATFGASTSRIEQVRSKISARGSTLPATRCSPYRLTDSIIYFASDGHPGFGGLDLFKATMTRSGGWKVENLGLPINSAADDFGITFASPGREVGYFSSNRGDARGYDHIFSFELPDLKILISGYVTDTDDEPVRGATIRIVGSDGSNQKAIARDDGSFSFPLQRGVSYVMLAGAKGYLNAKQGIHLRRG